MFLEQHPSLVGYLKAREESDDSNDQACSVIHWEATGDVKRPVKYQTTLQKIMPNAP